MTSPKIYQFDGIKVDVAAMRIRRGTADLVLEAKTFRLLQFLIENRERVLSKEEIFQAVWQGTAVSDNALTRAIAQIRKVLEDDPRKPRYIDTVPTVGYRFIGVLDDGHAATPLPAHTARRTAWWAAPWVAVGMIVLAVAAIAFWHSRLRPAQGPMFHPIPLTTYRGSAFAPSFSPDGDQVAFVWDGEKQDNYDIYVKTLGSDATPLRLTTDPAPDMWPAWSPDGRTIAFQHYVGDKIELMLIPALGGPERKLGEFHQWTERRGFSPVWSNDSKWLIVPVDTGTSAALYHVSVETGEASQIIPPQETLSDTFPALSPDGKTLLFVRRVPYNLGELWSMHVDNNLRAVDTPQRIPTGNTLVLESKWTSDGTEIVALALGGAIRMPARGSEAPQPFPLADRNLGFFDLSRHGNRMAYSAFRGDSNIWRIDLSTKIPHPERLIASTQRDVYPQYSPDGSKLAFYSDRTAPGVQTQLWVADADGRNQQQLTFMRSGFVGTPRWSPDGRTFAFESLASGDWEVYTISAGGGKEQQLTHNSNSFLPTWSRDGQWVYYTSNASGRNELWKIPAGGGAAVQITHNDSSSAKATESADGKTIYFCKETGAGSIWKMPVGGGSEEQLTGSLYLANFEVTKKGIYYMTAPGADGTSELRFYSFANKTSKLILPMGIPENGLDVSPDGRYLAYAELDNPASELMLIENFH
jgi:Tol biopolymer transport system component/DNA-binding winged helix-turn-helix (wHTH) protein